MSHWNWMVFVCFAVWTGLYALFTPVYAAFVVSNVGWGFGVGYFFSGRAVMRAQKRALGLYKRKKKTMSLASGRRIFSYIRKYARVERIFLTGVLAFENAMHTALAYGAICVLSQMDRNRIQNTVSVDFVSGRTQMELTGIMSMSAGHIILAVIREGILIGREKIGLWINTRLKA
ncbi:MAG: hypothetical protein E7322_00945 [Clostridiales bacterium]|nr:hypothetical protein [Clostridiales bacterium]